MTVAAGAERHDVTFWSAAEARKSPATAGAVDGESTYPKNAGFDRRPAASARSAAPNTDSGPSGSLGNGASLSSAARTASATGAVSNTGPSRIAAISRPASNAASANRRSSSASLRSSPLGREEPISIGATLRDADHSQAETVYIWPTTTGLASLVSGGQFMIRGER